MIGIHPSNVAISAARRHGRLLAVVLLLGILLTVFELSGLREHFSLDSVRQLILRHRIGGLVLFVIVFALANLAHIPGWGLLVAAVLTLGALWGGAITYVAAVVASAVTFLAIRALGGDALRRIDNRLAVRILGRLDAHPIVSVALLRVLFQTAPTLNYALAMSGIRFRSYMAGTLAGLPLPIAVFCIFFDTLTSALHLN